MPHSSVTQPEPVALGADERLVAVATTGNGRIDQHFGHADSFSVYAVGPEGVRFVAVREVEHYCQGGYGDEDKREIILRALADCCALFVARVGEGPRARLEKAGIEPVDDYPFGSIEESISDWYRRAKG
ncbi:NifB/NifX family molybdenum-iron cluster-binding protein [Imhoffiella purpurea]|uniref:Protein NifB n=1 Tax=Imhoffiella purpurea TaxID=1249627 RepID=W9VIB2_9GAMM|nr:NifB/NifX family molybdenum-iron cluster-binding protein [Imhoffiella purpurea]EXJ15797.1 protein NifB [Imhoffiella purpurea]